MKNNKIIGNEGEEIALKYLVQTLPSVCYTLSTVVLMKRIKFRLHLLTDQSHLNILTLMK